MNRAQMIAAAELELLNARRQLAQSEKKPELLQLAANGLKTAARLFLSAGMTHRGETVWRYGHRLQKRRVNSGITTLQEVIAEWRFGRDRKRGDA